MYGDEYRNEVLLNGEVRFLAHVLTRDGKELKLGPVHFDDLGEIAGLYPSKKNDPNAAHIMLFRLRERWYYAANFVYNSGVVKNKFEQTKDYLETARICSSEKRWGGYG